jgi:uncharacterized protein (DUF342 family)
MATTENTATTESPDLDLDLQEVVEDALNDAASTVENAYELKVSADGISLLLDCPDPHADLAATLARIEEDFIKLNLPEYPDAEVLANILENACKPGESLDSFPIVKGWGATPSVNGRLEWLRDFFGAESGPKDEDEVHDFWEQNDQLSVEKDELLARVHLPVEGQPGLDVFSREIPVAKPASVKLRSGKGVRLVEEGEWVAYYAEFAGRIRYQDESLVVDDVYVIKGDVSLETGNINHTGTVHIEGDVKTGATVQADGDIMVRGMMDPCNIQCGGSLTVGGGIVGLEEYLIEVAGELKAMYISCAVVQCGSDITVTNEIAHADIKAYGKVMVPTGRIAGGRVMARKGIQTAEAGGSGSVKTLLMVGMDFTVDKRVAERESKIRKLDEAKEKIQEVLKKAGFVGGQAQGQENPELTELSDKMKKIDEAINREYAASKADLQKSKSGGAVEVTMLREVWSGTTIQIGEHKTVVRASIEKPRIARLNKDKVSILPLGEGNMPGQ